MLKLIFESILMNFLELGFVDWKVEFAPRLCFWGFAPNRFFG